MTGDLGQINTLFGPLVIAMTTTLVATLTGAKHPLQRGGEATRNARCFMVVFLDVAEDTPRTYWQSRPGLGKLEVLVCGFVMKYRSIGSV